MSFGDLALVHKQRRAGTVLTLTNCFFAVVSADGFHKLIKKNQAAKVNTVIQFLKQIPYIEDWIPKDIQDMYLLCQEKTIEQRGTTIIQEGEPSKKVIIVYEGEVEVVKTNLSTFHFNESSGLLAMREQNANATLLKSQIRLSQTMLDHKSMYNNAKRNEISIRALYQGSQFYTNIQNYLNQQVDKKLSFKDKIRSKIN